jgi:hypothetical protein
MQKRARESKRKQQTAKWGKQERRREAKMWVRQVTLRGVFASSAVQIRASPQAARAVTDLAAASSLRAQTISVSTG